MIAIISKMNKSYLKYHDIFIFRDQSKHASTCASMCTHVFVVLQQKVPLLQGGHSLLDCVLDSENIKCASDISHINDLESYLYCLV